MRTLSQRRQRRARPLLSLRDRGQVSCGWHIVRTLDSSLLVDLEETVDATTRCFFAVKFSKPENPDILEFFMEGHKVWANPTTLTRRSASLQVEDATTAVVKYFRAVGEG